MRELRGGTALVTGASGGLGREIARRLAREGMDVVVSGRREDVLAACVAELQELDVRAAAVPADLCDLSQIVTLVERAEEALGPLDVLVCNAGVESVGMLMRASRAELTSTVDVNLTAPMLLTNHVVPGMLSRGRGHVVYISSLAGKLGPAYNASYAATKAGLVAMTQSLRAEHAGDPVGFSVVCPGFIAGEGMYQRMVDDGHRSNRLMGETTVSAVGGKVVDAIRQDKAEIVESGAPVRPMLAFAQVAPGLVERVAPRFGVTRLFAGVARERGRG